ncbi:MAG: ascorbate-dependent monooxygenase [Bacteroidetes bacterium]|nr:MAG: ascorbate-dependent monooxygenase [Bacteroidota bacterium]
MKKISFLLCLGICALHLNAQPTFSEHISPIIYEHCTSCHRPGEVGPMPFTSYTEVAAYAGMIEYVTSIRYMPPWKPDASYSHFLDENLLTDSEIASIKDWVQAGAPQGNPALEYPLPTFPSGSQLGTPDLQIAFEQSYTHVGNNTDEYRVFVLPTNLMEDKDLVALELRPGNRAIVHHALFSWDTTGTAQSMDNDDPGYGYAAFGGFGIPSAGLNQYPGYVPGQRVREFPQGMGQKLFAGADILVQMHYAPTGVDETDSSVVNLFFAEAPVSRYIYNNIMLPTPGTLTNGPFIIPANSVKTFHGVWNIPSHISLLAVTPHMHLLGQNWEVLAIRPNGDTIPLIRINEWDFNWQGTYRLDRLIPLEAGSQIHAYATYDNTVNNPLNPNNPPLLVKWGEKTSDEMYYLPITYVNYQQGDENVVLTDAEDLADLFPQHKMYPISPNPASSEVQIGFALEQGEQVWCRVMTIEGKEVAKLSEGKLYPPGHQRISWDFAWLPAGVYMVEVRAGMWRGVEKVVKF